jgi:hypothetical protein
VHLLLSKPDVKTALITKAFYLGWNILFLKPRGKIFALDASYYKTDDLKTIVNFFYVYKWCQECTYWFMLTWLRCDLVNCSSCSWAPAWWCGAQAKLWNDECTCALSYWKRLLLTAAPRSIIQKYPSSRQIAVTQKGVNIFFDFDRKLQCIKKLGTIIGHKTAMLRSALVANLPFFHKQV